jgi:hypothetical protein
VLRSVADAGQAQQIAAAARHRLLAGLALPVPAPADTVTGPLPAGVVLKPGERVLWAGGPVRVPWWFGTYDTYLSAFGLVWLAGVCLMGALAVTGGAGAFASYPLAGDRHRPGGTSRARALSWLEEPPVARVDDHLARVSGPR